MNFLGETLSFLSSDSFFSSIVTLYTLLLLYLPSVFLHFIFSPVLLTTLVLLLYLRRLGATQSSAPERSESDSRESNSTQLSPSPQQIRDLPARDSNARTELEPLSRYAIDSNTFYADFFVEWDVRAPLEVIHEEYEGEDADGNDAVSEGRGESEINAIRRYASLSLFYPESDSDASSELDFPTYGDWEEEEDGEGLIEITLDEKRNGEFDEENLIEIDLSPTG